ncbi:MAG: hypothetical protein C4527_19000 [Candidatus Omnitrophota bacterium]|jgi:transcription elongation factor GreA|nr:MAG: hypothetical protein C4527_19000 [Candidatus Omnitrophota bacterium]
MISLDELNDLRVKERWEEITVKTREHLKADPGAAYVLRGLAQALEKQELHEEEYADVLYRLLEMKDRIAETAQKLAHYYKQLEETGEAIRHLEIAIEAAAEERQYDLLEDAWMELTELAPDNLPFFLRITSKLDEYKQRQRAAVLLQMLLPAYEERKDWQGQLRLLKQILEYTPKDKNLREPIIDTFQKIHEDSPHFTNVLVHTGIRGARPLQEALEELEVLAGFLPDTYVLHPDWGIGRVKDLDMVSKRVLINFQRKRDHSMDLDLAVKAVQRLAHDDFRVLCVIDVEKLHVLVKERPLQLIKLMLRSFNNELTAKEIKGYLVPAIIPIKNWNPWWSAVSADMRKDPYISVSAGSGKKFILREHAASDEDALLKRFDETKAAHAKVDQIYDYLRTTKKTELHEHIIKHFSHKIHAITPHRRSTAERVELWFTNEDLKDYVEGIESLPVEILTKALDEFDKIKKNIQDLRFKSHQLRFVLQLKSVYPEKWTETYQELLLEPNILIRNELEEALLEAGKEDLLTLVVDMALVEFRQFPYTFIWLAGRELAGNAHWMNGKIQKAVLIDRLLLLVDYLTSQAKRRDRDEALWLRKVAADAREIIRKNNYALFKEHIREADRSVAESIYRRAQTNEGLDLRTASDLTTIVRARFPELFQTITIEQDGVPESWLCLKESLSAKQALFKQLVEIELPTVVQEIEIARQHGDLRENAEYHAAKDKQKLLAAQTSELQDALARAQSIDPEKVDPDRIAFGVVFKITPVGSKTVEEYTMLGPWESDPNRNILSYQAPFARAFYGKTKGDLVEIDLPLHTGRYEIISIEPVSPEIAASLLSFQTTTLPTPPDTVDHESVQVE